MAGVSGRKLVTALQGGGWICHYCGRWFGRNQRGQKECTVDHVIPRALGGPNAPWNYVISCNACNNAKGNRTYEDFTGKPELPPQVTARTGHRTTAEFVAFVAARKRK